jgi:hypothetical protein
VVAGGAVMRKWIGEGVHQMALTICHLRTARRAIGRLGDRRMGLKEIGGV